MTQLADEVFYVDDSPDDRLFATHCHQRGGYSFPLVAYSTGFAVMLDIERRATRGEMLPRLLVADHYMPVMDGPELFRLVRADQRFSGIMLALCSGGDDPADWKAARDAGAQIVLQKPLDFDTCREILEGSFAQ
jgi:CheY-like chemotaxis protein